MTVEKFVSKYGDIFVVNESNNVTNVYTRRQGCSDLLHQFGMILPFDKVADLAEHLIDTGYYTWQNQGFIDPPFVFEEDIENELDF